MIKYKVYKWYLTQFPFSFYVNQIFGVFNKYLKNWSKFRNLSSVKVQYTIADPNRGVPIQKNTEVTLIQLRINNTKIGDNTISLVAKSPLMYFEPELESFRVSRVGVGLEVDQFELCA